MYRNPITQLLSEDLDAHDHLLWPKMMSIHFTHLKCPTSGVCSEHTAWTTSRPQVKCWNCPVEQHISWRLDAAVVPTFSSKHFLFTSLREISSEREGGTNRPQTANICVKHLSVTNPLWDWTLQTCLSGNCDINKKFSEMKVLKCLRLRMRKWHHMNHRK